MGVGVGGGSVGSMDGIDGSSLSGYQLRSGGDGYAGSGVLGGLSNVARGVLGVRQRSSGGRGFIQHWSSTVAGGVTVSVSSNDDFL
jgi:hypothetical protein